MTQEATTHSCEPRTRAGSTNTQTSAAVADDEAMGPGAPVEACVDTLDDEQRRLVESHLHLVRAIASRWRARCRSHVDYSDLLQVGALGLVDAARRYDPSRPGGFAAFAHERIRGSICDALRSLDPLTRKRRRNVRQMEEAIRSLEAQSGRAPDDEELARMLGWRPAEVTQARDDLASLAVGWAQTLETRDDLSADEGFGGSEGDACQELLKVEMKALLVEAIRELPERDQLVLSLYYDEGLTMKEIGEILDVTESRVSQVHSAAVARLRKALQRREVLA